MLVCIVSKQDYENTFEFHKPSYSIDNLKYVCIGNVNNVNEVYGIANALPCLTDIKIYKENTIPICLILANP